MYGGKCWRRKGGGSGLDKGVKDTVVAVVE